MKNQLVIQFTASENDDFDSFIEIEEEIINSIAPEHEVDGHDFGMSEFNIFIITNNPQEASSLAIKAIPARHKKNVKMAYRSTDDESYTVMYPFDFTGKFEVK